MNKPKYKVPSMKEIEQLPKNGFKVVSTFSGGGGSCLGYRMAGYDVVYANEFVEEAQKTYRANHSAYLDTRDIRQVTPESILKITGLQKGEIDLFDGSPPCCAFSTAGKREKGWGEKRAYSDGKVQRVDDLFYEYARLVRGLQPKTFVAENVSGLVKGTAKGYFKRILVELKDCGYNVQARLLNAKWLGVPQTRERLIFVGVRKDLEMQPVYPKPLGYIYTLGDALQGVVNDPVEEEMRLNEMRRHAIGKVLQKMPKNPDRAISGSKYMGGSYFNLVRQSMLAPCNTVCQAGGNRGVASVCHPYKDRKFTVAELKRITSIPDDFVCTGDYSQQWERLARMVPPVMMKHIAETIAEEILCNVRIK